MATIAINGTNLQPQPARATWEEEIIQSSQGAGKLNGTDATGAYKIFRISAPVMRGTTFNWASFENQVLTSLQAFPPGDEPDLGSDVVYASGVVSRKIKTYQTNEDRMIQGVEMEILVVVG